jgi:hypothetical protein
MAFGAFLVLSPSAHADIFEIEAATSCPGSVGGGLCNGSVPFSVTSLLGGGITVTASTEKFVITDNFGTFSFVFTLDPGLQNKTDNGSCQINGVRRRSLTRARVPIATGPSSPSGMTSLAEGHFIVGLATSCPRPLRSLPFPGPLPIALVRHPATLTWASCQCRAHHTSQFPAPSPVQDCPA